jgi:hypothetical protein
MPRPGARPFLGVLVPAALAAEERTPLPAAEEVRATLERILARPEFRPPERSLLQRAWDWASEGIRGFLERLLSGMVEGLSRPGVFEMFLIICIVLLIAILLHMAWTILAYREPPEARRRAPEPERALPLSPDPHLASAAELAAAGRFLEAAHSLYQGVVLWLDGTGRARFHPFKTGGDYARELGTSPPAEHFRALLGAFYPVASGGRTAFQEAYVRMRASASRMGVPH